MWQAPIFTWYFGGPFLRSPISWGQSAILIVRFASNLEILPFGLAARRGCVPRFPRSGQASVRLATSHRARISLGQRAILISRFASSLEILPSGLAARRGCVPRFPRSGEAIVQQATSHHARISQGQRAILIGRFASSLEILSSGLAARRGCVPCFPRSGLASVRLATSHHARIS